MSTCAKRKRLLNNAVIDLYDKVPWPDWWAEFVSEQNKWGPVRYINVEQFCKKRDEPSTRHSCYSA